MTDQEIIKKYLDVIEKNINRICQDKNIADDFVKKAITQSYQQGFVEGFKEGREEERQKHEEEKKGIALNLLKLGIAAESVANATGISVAEIKFLSEKKIKED